MIYAGTETIETLMLGEMGIKTIMAGSENVYERPGAYVYIQLDTKESK